MSVILSSRAATLVVLGLALNAPAVAIAQDAEIRVGVTAPGNYMAHAINLMEEVGARTGLDFVYEPGPLGDQLAALTSGDVDIIATPLNATDERRGMGITFSETPTLMNAESLYVMAPDTANHTSLAGLGGQRIGALAGTTL